MIKVNGQEFVRNVHIEQDKAKLEEEKIRLDNEKEKSVNKGADFFDTKSNTSYDDLSLEPDTPINNQLEDVVLPPRTSLANKKKYIMLGFILVIVFITGLVIARIVSNKTQENNLNSTVITEDIQKEKILDKIDTEEEYAKTIQENKSIEDKLDIEQPFKAPSKTVQKEQELQLPEPIKEKPPVKIEKPTKPKEKLKDLFELEKPKKEVKKVVKEVKKTVSELPKKIKQNIPNKKIVIAPPSVKDLDKNAANKLSGYYIQIAALTKKPSKSFLANIIRRGYDYAIYPITIKGKKYNKVLIGAYPTKRLAKKVIGKVKKDFKNPSAYIIKF